MFLSNPSKLATFSFYVSCLEETALELVRLAATPRALRERRGLLAGRHAIEPRRQLHQLPGEHRARPPRGWLAPAGVRIRRRHRIPGGRHRHRNGGQQRGALGDRA